MLTALRSQSPAGRRSVLSIRVAAFLGLLLFASSSDLPAQYRLHDSFPRDAYRPDTSLDRSRDSSETPNQPTEKSTGLAMLLSAALPGAGQVYTERYLSIPVIWGFGAYFGIEYARLNRLKQDYASQFDASVRVDTVARTGDTRLRDIRDFYRDERDTFAIYVALTYILNIVDAYVGASLYGFDVSPDLSGGARLRVTYRFR